MKKLLEQILKFGVVGVVCFAAAVVITALCFQLRKRENQKKDGADKPNRHEQEEKSQ